MNTTPSFMGNSTKIMVCGGRDFSDTSFLYKKLDEIIGGYRNLLFPPDEIIIVQGDACGADLIAKQYAEDRGLRHLDFPADWNKYGKSAGFRRNKEMINIADRCVAFWNGKSHGTKHSISCARAKGIPVDIIRYD